MKARAVTLVTGLVSAAMALSACGVSVAKGAENASTHPASGIFVSPTVGGGDISAKPAPLPPYRAPSNTPPPVLPPGQAAAVSAIKGAVTNGCWQNANAGNVYGAYDQNFWWQGSCGDTIGQVTIELYPSAAKASAEAHHMSPTPLLARYQDGAVLVDVYSNAPGPVISSLNTLKGLAAVPGYGS